MENQAPKLHIYQQQIIKKLTFQPEIRFNDLIINGLESEHMNYHLKKLLSLGLVQKKREGYTLTDKGKDYANLLDDNIEIIEKQPKTSIIIRGVRVNPESREIEHLLNKRLRQPYFGKIGRLTGKVRFGETFEEAVRRELYEETGLHAETVVLEEIYRKLRKREDGTVVQDVIFYICFVTGFSGTMIERTEFQENFWISKKGFEQATNLDAYDDLTLNDQLEALPLRYSQSIGIAEGF